MLMVASGVCRYRFPSVSSLSSISEFYSLDMEPLYASIIKRGSRLWATIILQRAFRSYLRRRTHQMDALILQAAGLRVDGSPFREQRSTRSENRGRLRLNIKRSQSCNPKLLKGERLNSDYPVRNDLYHPIRFPRPIPPPYCPPPSRSESPPPPPPPPTEDLFIYDSVKDLPLPPPPPMNDFTMSESRSSSISSVDSGYPPYEIPVSPLRWFRDSASPPWISSPVSSDGHWKGGGIVAGSGGGSSRDGKKTVRISTPALLENERNVGVMDETLRKRQYRVGLNLFNQNPERGMEYLFKKDFVDYSPSAVAKFLMGRKGLSKKMIGEYCSSLQRPFNISVLHHFMSEIDFSGIHIDIALRHLQRDIRLPGEAQKIEKIIEVFASRYIQCNTLFANAFRSLDTIFVLSYALILLNTDLHSPANKNTMGREDFIRNLKGVDVGSDLDTEMLGEIYERIKGSEFKSGVDHQTQVSRVESTIRGPYDKWIGRLSEPHRRLVCFCRLSEILDRNKKEKKEGAHPRGVFLFNDLILVTKSVTKKKTNVHQYRYSIPLRNIRVNNFSSGYYPHGISIHDKINGRILASFNAKSETDQQRFVSDLQESVAETIEMEKANLYMDEMEAML